MKRIAIISFTFSESTICLAKHIAECGVSVDYYYVDNANAICKGKTEAFEFNPQQPWHTHRLEAPDMSEMAAYMKGLPVNIHVLGLDTSRRFLGRYKFSLWCLFRRIKRQKYDIINIVGQNSFAHRCHNALRGQNIVHTFHEVGSHQDGVSSSPVVNASIADHSKVIVHSQSTYERYVQLDGVRKENVQIIPFGKFDTALLYAKSVDMQIPLDLSKPTFLFFGLLKPYKGLDILAAAMKELSSMHQQFNLIIAGKGDDPQLRYFKSLDNCFVLNRYISNDEMMHLIEICNALVLPYHTASQTGIIPICALYSKPVIATAVGAFPEMVSDGVNGILVKPESPAQFAESLKACIEEPSVLDNLSKGMSQFGKGDRFDWDKIAEKTITFMQS